MNFQRYFPSRAVFALALTLTFTALSAWPGYAQLIKGSNRELMLPKQHKTIDPCLAASEDQLKLVISAGIGGYFPIKNSKDGEHVTISDPRLSELHCPNLRIAMRVDIRYQKTRGFPQYSTSGDARFASPLVAKVTYSGLSDAKPTRVDKALACLTDINLVGLNLKNVPNWLDNTWIRAKLNDKLADQACFDITSYVNLYLQQGGSMW